MDCNFKAGLVLDIVVLKNAVERLDSDFSRHFNETPATDLAPTESFMSAWRKIKNIKDILTTITFED